jgi:hypothetical protein
LGAFYSFIHGARRETPIKSPVNNRIPAYQNGQVRTIEKEKALISQGFK